LIWRSSRDQAPRRARHRNRWYACQWLAGAATRQR